MSKNKATHNFSNGFAMRLVADIAPHIKAHEIPVSDYDMHRILEIIPDGKPARYDDDVWDFNECFVHIRDAKNIIDFRDCVPGTKNALKDYALWCIECGNKIQTASSRVTHVRCNLKRLTERNAKPFSLINFEDVKDYLESLDCRPRTRHHYAIAFMEFFEQMRVANRPCLVNKTAMERYVKLLYEKTKGYKTKHYERIPDWYYDLLITRLDNVMRDESKTYNERMTAGIMLINSQLGLRDSEIPIIPKDCIRYADTTHGTLPYFLYRSRKAARGTQEVIIVEHVGTTLLYETLDYYLKLREQSPFKDADYLYVDGTTKQYPIKSCILNHRYDILVKRYVPESAQAIDGVRQRRLRHSDNLWSIPTAHCFRSSVFCMMEEQGVAVPYIEKMMSHAPGAHEEGYYSGIHMPKIDVWERITGESD